MLKSGAFKNERESWVTSPTPPPLNFAEFGAPATWCPYMSKDIDVMEKVQRRATCIVPELKHSKYEDRLKKLEIYKL